MSGYIGSKASVTQVDGYNRTEADDRYVNASGDTMTGQLDTPYQVIKGDIDYIGMSIRNTKADYSTSFIDAQNRTNAADSHIFFHHETDGSSTISFGTQPAGDFTDRRISGRMLINGNGHVTMPYQPYIYGSPTNTSGAGIANSFYTISARGGMAFSSDRITVPVGGVYHISFNTISDNTTGRVDANILINGGAIVNMLNEDNGTGFHYKSGSITMLLAANDYIQFKNNDWYNSTNTGFDDWRTASVALIG